MRLSSADRTGYAALDLAVRLYDHYESIGEVRHYYGLLAIYSLAKSAEASADEELWDRVAAILRRFPDEIDHPRYNFPSYRIGGIPQAYLLANGRMADRADLVREYAEEMMTAPRDAKGIVVMPWAPERGLIWIDSAMATSIYLLNAGLALAEDRYLDEAVHQSVAQYDEFLDPGNGLLHQCKNFVAPQVYSGDHWGRGNGWGLIALAELAAGLPADHPGRAAVVQRFESLAAALLPHQSQRGLWRQEIPEPLSYEESSGTGLILYSYGLGLRHGLLDEEVYGQHFDRGVAGLVAMGVNPDFSTMRSCPGCLCPGTGEERGSAQAYMTLKLPYRDELHGAGPIILALSEAHRRGVGALVPLADASHQDWRSSHEDRHHRV